LTYSPPSAAAGKASAKAGFFENDVALLEHTQQKCGASELERHLTEKRKIVRKIDRGRFPLAYMLLLGDLALLFGPSYSFFDQFWK